MDEVFLLSPRAGCSQVVFGLAGCLVGLVGRLVGRPSGYPNSQGMRRVVVSSKPE